MNLLPGLQSITTNTQVAVGTAGKPIRVFNIELISSATASALKLYAGTTTGGSLYTQVDGIASSSVLYNYAGGKRFATGCFALSDAAITSATITFTEEF